MSNSIVPVVDQAQSSFDSIRRFYSDGREYWLGRELMSLFGYKSWQKFGAKESPTLSVIQRAIVSTKASQTYTESCFIYIDKTSPMPNGGFKISEDCELTRYAAYITAMCGDVTKREIAAAQSYFAAKTREAEVIIPQQNDRLLMMQLENENLRLANENMRIQQNILGLQNDMLCLHGAPVVLALAGKSDQVVELEKQVTVIVEPESGKSDKIMTAEQLKSLSQNEQDRNYLA